MGDLAYFTKLGKELGLESEALVTFATDQFKEHREYERERASQEREERRLERDEKKRIGEEEEREHVRRLEAEEKEQVRRLEAEEKERFRRHELELKRFELETLAQQSKLEAEREMTILEPIC